MKTVRYSKQREAILLDLQSRFDHPTADQVYSSLKRTHPGLSLGTVYRNLGFLEQNGQIRKLDIGDGTVRYDGNINPHIHFICSNCHTIIDLPLSAKLAKEICESVNQIEIEDIQIQIKGKCQNCKVSHTS